MAAFPPHMARERKFSRFFCVVVVWARGRMKDERAKSRGFREFKEIREIREIKDVADSIFLCQH